MNQATANPVATAADKAAFAESAQLFRYASDLQELIGQFGSLQQRYQQVLEYLGRGEQGDDLLLNTLRQSFDLYLVTDTLGDISHISPGLEKALGFSAAQWLWRPITELMPLDQCASINTLGTFFRAGATGAIQMRRVTLCHADQDRAVLFDALVLQGGNPERLELFWLLSPADAEHNTAHVLENCLPLEGSGSTALMITDPDGRIRAVNAAFGQITGYARHEVMGHTPRMLDSGLQSNSFFDDFWRALQANGSWSGDIFNRRKGGQVYFQWQTVRAAQNGVGETLAYVCAFNDLSQPRDASPALPRFGLDDAMVCLPSRALFEQRLANAMALADAQKIGLWVCALSLDGLKTIVDHQGQAAGEQVMRECSARLTSLMQAGDSVASDGSSGFLVVLRGAQRGPDLGRVARTLLRSVSDPLQVDGKALSVAATLGCARYPQSGTSTAALIRRANAAMQLARKYEPRYCCDQGDTCPLD